MSQWADADNMYCSLQSSVHFQLRNAAADGQLPVSIEETGMLVDSEKPWGTKTTQQTRREFWVGPQKVTANTNASLKQGFDDSVNR